MPYSYIKSLPLPSLPTFWSEEELQLLVGTTLAPAMVAKLKSLRREYDLICESSSRWYNIVEDKITFDDWLFVDAMYRSRALEMPGIGHCMVPCIDLANHASGDETIARYEKDHDGNAVLLLQEDKNVRQDEEITITYGDEKGACEMLFSYGFIEDKMDSAEALFLSLTIPEDDKYRIAKTKFAECAPGFKVIDDGDGGFDFDGDYVWLLCVNEEDGLRFEISRTVDGEEEEAAFFQGTELTGGATQLRSLLEESELYDLYILRAITIFQSRVFDQLQLIAKSRDVVERINDHFREVRGHSDENDTRDRPYNLSITLRRLEQDLQDKAHHFLEAQVRTHPLSSYEFQFMERSSKPTTSMFTNQLLHNHTDTTLLDELFRYIILLTLALEKEISIDGEPGGRPLLGQYKLRGPWK